MELQITESSGVRLAIEGCGHGTLHAIYASIAEACKQKGWPGVDLLITGGDFQSVRNAYDLNCVSMPAKYRSMCDFHEYYSGRLVAPYLTVFVGGNHEASNYLFELYYGGWVAPNIYYMGAANVLRLGPLRIAAMSGIWKGYNFRKPHYERLPYNESDIRSIYHVRELDVRKLLQIRTQVDIGISHDWPKGLEWKGNWKQLFRFKKHFEDDARNGQLGSVAAQQVMDLLRPSHWFSAHLHCKYAAIVNHSGKGPLQQAQLNSGSTAEPSKNADEIDLDEDIDMDGVTATGPVTNEDELELDLDSEPELPQGDRTDGSHQSRRLNRPQPELEANGHATHESDQKFANAEAGDPNKTPASSLQHARAALPESFRRPKPAADPLEHPQDIMNDNTHFLALDKCLPGRHFLQLMAIPAHTKLENERPLKLQYDREWLAITRTFALDEPLQLGDPSAPVPQARPQMEYKQSIEKRRMWVDEHISDANLAVPENFEATAPVYDDGNWNMPQYAQVLENPNPQTARFCEMLQIPNPFDISDEERYARIAAGPRPDPDAERLSGGRGRGSFGRGRGRGGSRGGGRGRGGRFRGR